MSIKPRYLNYFSETINSIIKNKNSQLLDKKELLKKLRNKS